MAPESALDLLPSHPVWGTALGRTKQGLPFWLGQGASEPEGQGAQGTQSGTSGDGTTGQGAGTTSTDQTDDEGGQSTETPPEDKVDRAEFERIRNQLSASDKARQEAQDKLKEIADKDKGELEKATERAKDLEAQLAAAQAELQQSRLEKAMLTDAEFGADKWHDPDDVLVRLNRAVKDEQVTVKDGEPDKDSVKKFLKDLSTKKAYLLKTTGSAGSNGSGGKSGEPVGGGDRRTKAGEDTDEQIRKRYRIR
jgi:hypothetical protein